MSVKIFTLSFSAQVQCYSSLNQMSINQKDSGTKKQVTNNQIQIHIYLHKSNELDHLLGQEIVVHLHKKGLRVHLTV